MRITLDEFLDPFEARVVVDADGPRFDLSALPRLEPMLLGREVAGVPDTVKMLCGICPVPHHLAGMMALEGAAAVPPAAGLLRRLLAHAATLTTLGPRVDPAAARFGAAVLAAAGAPGHFPDVALPGGVRPVADPAALAALPAAAPAPPPAPADAGWPDDYPGADAALVDAGGFLDPLGDHVSFAGRPVPVAEFLAGLVESRPGAPAPRPLFRGRGYRVGPLARLGLPTRHRGPLPASIGPAAAQAVAVADALAAVVDLAGPAAAALAAADPAALRAGPAEPAGAVVDGPRGLLVHEYAADAAGRLTAARILTPTAQNEPWLAGMLAAMDPEQAIRAADPCLPCTSAPAGAMGVIVDHAEEED